MEYEKITVFCAASQKCDKYYFEQAEILGSYLGKSGRTIIYGGGNIGLMGKLADASLKEGGKVVGVIPSFLEKLELGHTDIFELNIVDTLHKREETMLKSADCIIALPGGIGTFSELLQAIVWKRLWQIDSDIFILNLNNYFNPLIQMLNKAIDENFLKEEFKNLWKEFNRVESLIEYFEQKLI